MARRKEARVIPTEKQKVKALLDVWAFADIIEFQGGGSKAFGECHKELMEWYYSPDRASKTLVLMPRGHLKSTLLSVLTTLHRIYINPNIRIFVGCATRFLSTSFIRQVKAYLEDVHLQEYVWNSRPHIEGRLIPLMDKMRRQVARNNNEDDTEAEDKKVVWRNDAIQVIRDYRYKEPTLVAGSCLSEATGFHYDVIQLDDVITFRNSNTLEKRESIQSWIYDLRSVLDPQYFDEDLFKALCDTKPNNRSRKIRDVFKKHALVGDVFGVIGTRYEPDDYYETLLKNNEELSFDCFVRNIYKNGENENDGYLWHERWDKNVEKNIRAEMSARRFASQYLNTILPSNRAVLKKDSIRWVHPKDITQKENGDVEVTFNVDGTIKRFRPFAVVDPAATTSKTSDFSAICVGGKDDEQNLYVLDMALGRWNTLELGKKVWELADKWKLKSVSIESIGFQRKIKEVLISHFIRLKNYRPLAFIDFKRKTRISKVEAIEAALMPYFNNGSLYMSVYLASNEELMKQIEFFPLKSVHDDGLDAMEILSEVALPYSKNARNRNKGERNDRVNAKYGGMW